MDCLPTRLLSETRLVSAEAPRVQYEALLWKECSLSNYQGSPLSSAELRHERMLHRILLPSIEWML